MRMILDIVFCVFVVGFLNWLAFEVFGIDVIGKTTRFFAKLFGNPAKRDKKDDGFFDEYEDEED